MSPELECEAPDVDEHSGSIKIVLTDENNVLALCAGCRSEFAYTRIIDEDPAGAARAHGGVGLTEWLDLTGFQQETLKAIARVAAMRLDVYAEAQRAPQDPNADQTEAGV
jgi:hypothetical protein